MNSLNMYIIKYPLSAKKKKKKKMANRELFGGAITTYIPENFIDVR